MSKCSQCGHDSDLGYSQAALLPSIRRNLTYLVREWTGVVTAIGLTVEEEDHCRQAFIAHLMSLPADTPSQDPTPFVRHWIAENRKG